MDQKTNRSKGQIALVGLVGLLAVTMAGSDGIYKAVSSMGKASIYTAGTYEGTAKGYGGTVTVSVTVSDKEITEVVIAGADETPEIGQAAFPELQEKILAAQGSGIDAVAGATYTSNGVQEAIDNALKKARGEAVEETEAETEKEIAAVENTTGNKFIPGTYRAKATGMHEIEVQVVVSENAIESIEILSQQETQGVADAALSQMPADIMAA